MDTLGNLYIADISDAGGSHIRKVTASTGVITTVAGSDIEGYNGDFIPATSAELITPTAVAVDGFGNFYLSDAFGERVRRVAGPAGVTAPPTFMPAGGSYVGNQIVTISDATPGATIYCSKGNTAPLPIPADLCSSPIEIKAPSTTTLNAIAVAPNQDASFENTATYSFRVPEVSFLNEVPSASGASTAVFLGEAMSGASIYYTTDGSIPAVGAGDTTLYTGPIVLTAPKTIKAIAVLAGYNNSYVASKMVPLPAAQPVISPGTGVFQAPQTVTITDATAGATIYCILNGAPAVPCAPSYLVSSSQEIVAYAEGGGFSRSIQSSANYVIK